MKNLPLKFACIVVRLRVLFIFLFVLLSIFFLFCLKNLKIDTSLGDFVPQKHPFILVQSKLVEAFGGLNQVSIALEVKQGDIFNKEFLAKVIGITNELYLMQGVNAGRITSLSARKIKYVEADEEGFRVMRVLGEIPQDAEQMQELKKRIINNPNVYIRMVSEDFKSTLIQADFESGVSSRRIFRKLREIAQREKDANTEIYLAGRPILEGWLDFYLPRMLKILLFTVIIIGLVLYLTFRSKRGVILPLLDSCLSTVWAMGIITLLGFNLDPSTMLVPFLILALGVSHSVHSMKRYYEEMRDKARNSKQAVINSVSSLFVPGLTSVITDGLAFLSLLLIPIATIRNMAAVAGLGVLCNFPASFIFTPAVLSFLKRPKVLEVRREERHTLVDRLLKRIVFLAINKRARRATIACFVLVGILGLIGARKTVIGDNSEGSSHLYPSSAYNRSERFINRQFGGTNSYYVFVEGKQDAMMDSRVLTDMESLQSFLKKEVPEAGYAISLVDYVKAMNMAVFSGQREYFSIPEDTKTIAEYVFLYDISSFPGDFTPVVSNDYSLANIKVELKDHKATTVSRVIEKTREWLSAYNSAAPRAKFLYGGGDIGILAAVNEIIARNMVSNVILIALLVLIYITIAFGSIFAALNLLLPLFLSILIVFAILGFSGVSLTMEILPLASLSMGLGINYGLYILFRMRQEGRQGNSVSRVLKISLLTSGKADFFSGMIVSLGVMACVFSSIRLQASFGATLGAALILNMLGTLVLLPVLISLFRPKFIFGRSFK
ncbi:RND family transporter [Candidatus Omnitrophota bacterium]